MAEPTLEQFNSGDIAFGDVHIFDVAEAHFPHDWTAQLVDLAERRSKPVEVDGTHPTSREDHQELVTYGQIGGVIIQEECPWLFEAYYGRLLQLSKEACGDEVLTNDDPRDVMNLLVNAPGQRGEAHIDNAPVSLLVYPQPAEAGGRLFISPQTDLFGYDDIVKEGIPVDPDPSSGIIFRGDRYVHVAERTKGSIVRVALNMNYHLPGQTRDITLREYSEYNQD